MNAVKSSYDPFRPHGEVAGRLYDAFHVEAAKRKTKSVQQWIADEPKAMHAQCLVIAQERGLRLLSLEDVLRCERTAMGHVDYASKWSIRLANEMQDGLRPSR